MKGLIALLMLAASTLPAQVTVTVSSPEQYNAQYFTNGRWTLGDTWMFTWSNDGNVYSTFDDGYGASNNTAGPKGSNIGIVQFTPDLQKATVQNPMTSYCGEIQTSCSGAPNPPWSDGATWKTRGIASINGTLYVTAVRQLDTPPWTVSSATLLSSSDHGKTITMPPASGPTGMMWNTGALMSPTLVWYCRDNSVNCPTTADGNNNYTYWTSNTDYSSAKLLRVSNTGSCANGACLTNVANWQYYSGAVGGSITNSSNWSANPSAATALFPAGIWASVYYIYQLGLYVGVADVNNTHETGNIVLFTSTNLTGPWTRVAIVEDNDDSRSFPSLAMNTLQATGNTVTVKLVTCGTYEMSPQSALANAYPRSNRYSVYYQTLTLQRSSTSSLQQNQSSYAESLNSFDSSLLVDYDFQPEPSLNNVTDYSGNGNNGTPNGANIYTSQGLANFNGSGQTVAGPEYSGTNFTTYIVFRQLLAHGQNESVLNNGNGTLQVHRNGTTGDSWTVGVGGKNANITETDGAWNLLVINRNGSTVNIYDSTSFPSGPPIATLNDVSLALSGNLVLGGTFGGEIAKFVFFNDSQTVQTMANVNSAIATEMASRGIYLPRAIRANEKTLDFQKPIGAWSVRRLLGSYAGNAMNVVRSSNHAATDIGFTSTGDLDIEALQTFCGNGSCRVNKIYDQSGNGWNLVPSKTGCEGTIWNSGNMVSVNGKPAIQWNPCGYYSVASGFDLEGLTASFNSVFQLTDQSSGLTSIMNLGDGGDPPRLDGDLEEPLGLRPNSYQVGWTRYNQGNYMSILPNADVSVWSIYDSRQKRFAVDQSWLAPQVLAYPGLDSPPFYVHYNATQLSIGDGQAGTWQESMVFPYTVGYQASQTISDSQAAYFGTGQRTSVTNHARTTH